MDWTECAVVVVVGYLGVAGYGVCMTVEGVHSWRPAVLYGMIG